ELVAADVPPSLRGSGVTGKEALTNGGDSDVGTIWRPGGSGSPYVGGYEFKSGPSLPRVSRDFRRRDPLDFITAPLSLSRRSLERRRKGGTDSPTCKRTPGAAQAIAGTGVVSLGCTRRASQRLRRLAATAIQPSQL